MAIRLHLVVLALLTLALTACGEEEPVAQTEEPLVEEGEELGIGEIDDLKADGGWGAALTCKPIPSMTPLANPSVVVSLDGLTLRLVDNTTGFEKVYPIGPGKIENGTSLTPTSLAKSGQVFYMRMDQPIAQETTDPKKSVFGMAYSCKIWWPDPDTGKKVPVFAGLPFIRLEGAPSLGYAIHGPIDSYTASNGGKLARGFVSHGCIRMESADVLELFALTQGKKVPVRVQQPVERRLDGTAVDIPQKWLLSECASDADCNFPGGFCKPNFYAGKSFCTASCTKFCTLDKFGYPSSFCVEDPEDDTQGICVLKSTLTNNTCRRYPGFELYSGTQRFGQPSVKADVCLPGTLGWVGAPCFSDLDCGLSKGSCAMADPEEGRPGFCTTSCSKFCPDLKSFPGTFCVNTGATGECVQKCTIQDECPFGYTCSPNVPRYNDPSTKASVCL